MKTLSIFIFTVILLSCNQPKHEEFVLVKGGVSQNSKSNLFGSNIAIKDFYIGRYEVTQKQWKEVMGNNPSKFIGDSLPVEGVTWYDCIEYCIKRSEKEQLTPYYHLSKETVDKDNIGEYDSLKWTVTINRGANGYRLPTEAEWEYAASGGAKSKNFTYSGSNDINTVAWYWKNSGRDELSGTWSWPNIEQNHNSTKPVGLKQPNELGIYDMSGNVREWCDDWYIDHQTPMGVTRSQRGGGWMGSELRCQSASRDNFEATGKGSDQGFRICRNK
ncbi:MAG: formylglycine-generating enzyme family protein [Marinilabiliaceae bacterium]|nr:formylglycine-generating enzyme family protein [Marinilabiliaceae bacterium]